jgi:hypothetical protein
MNKKPLFSRRFLAVFVVTASVGVFGQSQTMPKVNIANSLDRERLEIIPVDGAHQASLPPLLNADISSFPQGSFVLKNQRDKAITVVDVVWTYADQSGHSIQKKLTCDGYYFGPVRSIVKPKNLSLITPLGYSSQEHFDRLPSTGVLHPLSWSAKEKSVLTGSISSVTVSIDSIIFEDGQIWGPDTHRYYENVLNRHSIMQALSAELAEADKSGEGVASRLENIRKESDVAGNRRSSWRRHYAELIRSSPNPQGTLKQLRAQEALPEFQHISGAKQ